MNKKELIHIYKNRLGNLKSSLNDKNANFSVIRGMIIMLESVIIDLEILLK